MKCPNCDHEYSSDDTICPVCSTALSNAPFEQLSQKKKRSPGKVFITLFSILFVLAILAYSGYEYYLYRVGKECKKATEQVMTYAHNMDFSSCPTELLPEPLKEEPNIRNLISKTIDDEIDSLGLSTLFSLLGIKIDTDAICDQLIKEASYKITNVDTTYNKCTITMETTNINYYNILDSVSDQVKTQSSEKNSSKILQGISNLFSALFHGGDDSSDVPELLSQWIEDLAADMPTETVTGTIVYVYKNGSWTVLSLDDNLFYNYYGLPKMN